MTRLNFESPAAHPATIRIQLLVFVAHPLSVPSSVSLPYFYCYHSDHVSRDSSFVFADDKSCPETLDFADVTWTFPDRSGTVERIEERKKNAFERWAFLYIQPHFYFISLS